MTELIKYIVRDGRFGLPRQRAAAPFKQILKWQLSGGRAKWPQHIPNHHYAPPPHRVNGDRLAVTWIGHATALIQTAGINILTDPFFSKRASPSQLIGPARVRDPGIALKHLPPIDVILLSHSHYDHLDKSALKSLAKLHKAKLITPLNNAHHAPWFNAVELDWHETHEHGSVKITALPALHWSKRSFSDTNKSLWGAFMIQTADSNIYFGADTGFGTGDTFREVRELFGPPRLSLLPIGAYEPRWFMAAQHMNPEESVTAHQLLGSMQSIAIHHATVQLTDEPVDAPAIALVKALKAANLSSTDFLMPDIGSTTWIN